MYLNLLTKPQQALFVKAARQVAERDELVAEVEESRLASLLAECDLAEDPGTGELDELLAEAPTTLERGPVRTAFLLELAGVAVIDGRSEASELDLLRQFAEALEVSEQRLNDIVAYAEAARDLVAAGRALLASE